MANAIMNKWKQELMQATANTALTGTVKLALARSAVNTFAQTQQFLSDVTSPHATRSDALASKTFTNGTFDTADGKFTAPASDGNTYNQLYVFVDTGSAATSPLVAFFDTGVTGLPATPNGGDINISIPNIFTL